MLLKIRPGHFVQLWGSLEEERSAGTERQRRFGDLPEWRYELGSHKTFKRERTRPAGLPTSRRAFPMSNPARPSQIGSRPRIQDSRRVSRSRKLRYTRTRYRYTEPPKSAGPTYPVTVILTIM